MEQFDPKKNYETTKQEAGYVPRKEADQSTYDRIGFKSGLEVHQQLDTKKKLFCRCPSGIYNRDDEYDAEIIRHMRPTLSELGEYDGTALMEFKTKKEIVYRIKNETTCTYEIDDTPPFFINREALDVSIEISLLSKLNIVGEVHITRKQYLDGSIPTGFQRTAIIGVEGEIPLKHKKIRLIQLSLEEDSCREISDVGHVRIFKTDRLGMPLIETVTYPDCVNPDEVKEACDYIRFLNRSTGKVRTGIGSGREDVNVSCEGGSRVEIKGVAHTTWIPELTHNECFRQWTLLMIRDKLKKSIPDTETWKMHHRELDQKLIHKYYDLEELYSRGNKLYGVNLPGFNGILSHFTQPGRIFADEISDRIKVIACIEKPNMECSEELDGSIDEAVFKDLREMFNSEPADTQLIFWGPEADIETALETIEERCRMAFEGVPNETRKSFPDGTTMFERVLPGADRMYPDTDSPPIPLTNKEIEDIRKGLPTEVIDNYKQLKEWNIPKDTYTYIFVNNLFPLIKRIIKELKLNPVFTGTFFGHYMKFIEGHYQMSEDFSYGQIFDLFKYILDNGLQPELIKAMIPTVYQHPKMDYDSVLTNINFKKISESEIIDQIPYLIDKYETVRISEEDTADKWIMGELRKSAFGNMPLDKLYNILTEELKKRN